MNLPEEQVRVIATNVGGSFGAKDPPSRHLAIAGLVSMQTGRPVKVWFTREEETLDSHMRAALVHCVKGGVTRDGRITAIKVRSYLDNGYWGGLAGGGSTGFPYARDACRYALDLYNRIPNWKWEVFQVRTNRSRSGPLRGRCNAEAMYPIECLLDDLASEVGVDPCELRTRHSIQTGDLVESLRAYKREPKPVSQVGYAACLEAGRQAIGWDQRNELPGSQPGSRKRGIGMAGAIHVAGSVQVHTANCELVLDSDGGVTLFNATPDQGSEQQTTLRQIVAEGLKMRYEAIGSLNADTGLCPPDPGPIASRTLFTMGTAAWRAAEHLGRQVTALAAEMLGEPEDRLDVRDGVVWLQPDGTKLATIGDVARFAGGEIRVSGQYKASDEPLYTFGFAAAFVEVEVDVETGEVKVCRIVSAHDVGRAINPEIVEGQVEGGVAQGLGLALTEGMYYDSRSGAALNQWFLDLKTPTIGDTPIIAPVLLELGNEGNPLGAKGCSEISVIAVPPAVRNAVYNATGARVDEIPITPDRVLAALAALPGNGTTGPGSPMGGSNGAYSHAEPARV